MANRFRPYNQDNKKKFNRKLTNRMSSSSFSREVITQIPLTEEVKEKIEMVLTLRYDPITRSLNLSAFKDNELFTQNQLIVLLHQPAVLLATLSIAAKNPNRYLLSNLNIQNNHIFAGEGLVWLRRIFPELQLLDLTGNRLPNLASLKCLIGFQIQELRLSGNPLCNTLEYIQNNKRNVQKLFPNLKILDNVKLTPIESKVSNGKMPWTMENNYPLPPESKSHEPNQIKEMVDTFVKNFFREYDNKKVRLQLVHMYHENATLSISSYNLTSKSGEPLNYGTLFTYKSCHARSDQKDIYKGREQINKAYRLLPPTKHDFGSLLIDVPFANAQMLQITINGMFVDNYSDRNKLHIFRSFCRAFCIQPLECGWCIISDMFFVTLPWREMITESARRLLLPIKKQPVSDDYQSPLDTFPKSLMSALTDLPRKSTPAVASASSFSTSTSTLTSTNNLN